MLLDEADGFWSAEGNGGGNDNDYGAGGGGRGGEEGSHSRGTAAADHPIEEDDAELHHRSPAIKGPPSSAPASSPPLGGHDQGQKIDEDDEDDRFRAHSGENGGITI